MPSKSEIRNPKSEIELSPRYDPQAVESKWYDVWEARGYFYAEADGERHDTRPQTGEVYCITIPPPNVTGSLHMGHALNHSVQDLLIRWNRMKGKLTLCVPGTDHASIAVHAKIEQQMATEGLSRHDLGRERFLERAWAWKEHYGGTIIHQLRTLGCSYDWRRERFTMDDAYTRAVQKVFVDWFNKGWIYRGYRIINWCTKCQTSLSDLEAPMVEQPGKLWHIFYPLAEPSPPTPLPGGEGSQGDAPPFPFGRDAGGEGFGSGAGRASDVPYHGGDPRGRPIWQLPDDLKELCRNFRREPTDAEAFLWECLRNRRLAGLKYRRQHSIGRYVADFYCNEGRLVVELEGAVHDQPDQVAYDQVRFKELQEQGFGILRLRNEELFASPETVLERIAAACSPSSGLPSPLGRGVGGEGSGGKAGGEGFEGGVRGIVVATTRPETMLGDTAVAVNPKDERYAHLVGKTVILPLMNREIPIVADDMVDRSFGTGAVKVTPAHDTNDFELGQRHDLPQIIVIGKDAVMTAEAKQYAGLDRYEARERVARDLEAQGLLVKTEDYPEAKVPRCARCDSVLEPLPLEQWFVSMKPMAARALEVIEAGRVRYFPERYTATALEWLRNLRDWNISRQLWWGQRIPAWQCRDCASGSVAGLLSGSTQPDQPPSHLATQPPSAWIVQLDPPTKCPGCGGGNLEQDPDVFDTWFSSGLWPQTVLGWPDDVPELKTFFPTSLLSTGRDILHLWVARMIMSSLDFCKASDGTPEVPFHHVYIHPTILNWEGKRMSKSLGTGVDPLDLIAEYGADATRFGLLYMCSTTQDVRFTEERIEMARNFCNKVWNASRLILLFMQPREDWDGTLPERRAWTLPDRWILSRYARLINDVNEALKNYAFDVAARALYDFVWSEFCDWYLELIKLDARGITRSGSTESIRKYEVRAIVNYLLDGALRLLHPFTPFITEEVWQRMTARGETSVMVQPYPKTQNEKELIDQASEETMAVLQQVVTSIRLERAVLGLQVHDAVDVAFHPHTDEANTALNESLENINHLANVGRASIFSPVTTFPQGKITGATRFVEVFVWPQGKQAIERAVAFIRKEESKLLALHDRRQLLLNNAEFMAKAPPEQVADAENAFKETEERLIWLSARKVQLESKLAE